MTFRITLASKTIWTAVAVCLAFILWQTTYSVTHAHTSQARAQDKPFAVEYYYRAKWGYADEFIRLFKRNHYPFLRKQKSLGMPYR